MSSTTTATRARSSSSSGAGPSQAEARRLGAIHDELEAEGFKRGTAAFAREALARKESGHKPSTSSAEPTPASSSSSTDDESTDEAPAARRRGPSVRQLAAGATSSSFAVGAKPGTVGGLAAGVLAAVLAVNYARGGPAQVRGWFRAKFLNQPYAAPEGPGNGTASLIRTWASPLQAPAHPTAADPYPARPTPELPGVHAPAPNPVLTQPAAPSGPSWLQLFPTGG